MPLPPPVIWQVRTLNGWLADQGAQRGDFVVDRLEEESRYVILRPLPPASHTTGHILTAIGDGHLEQVESLSQAPSPSWPALQVISGDLAAPGRTEPPPARRGGRAWWRRGR